TRIAADRHAASARNAKPVFADHVRRTIAALLPVPTAVADQPAVLCPTRLAADRLAIRPAHAQPRFTHPIALAGAAVLCALAAIANYVTVITAQRHASH